MSTVGLGPRLRAVIRIRNILTAATVPLILGSVFTDTGKVAKAAVWGLTCGLVVALLAAAIFWRPMRFAETASQAARHSNAEKMSLTAVLKPLPIPAWRRDDELTLVDNNTAHSEWLELMRNDVLGDHLELGAHSIDLEGRGLAVRDQETGIMLSENHHVVHAGERHLFEFSGVPLGTQGGVGNAIALLQVEGPSSTAARTRAAG